MAKITEYPKVTNLKDDNVFLVDGPDGTKGISAKNLKDDILASPTLTGTPKAPTASAGTNTTQIATTAFVQTAVANLVDSAPETMNTLDELSKALGDDPNFAATVANQIGTKANASDFNAHVEDTTRHITSAERTLWNKVNNKVDKTTYEYNKEIANPGKICIGSFPCYDSNISVEIKITTNGTFNGTLIIATQNISTTGTGSIRAAVYGDPLNVLTDLISIQYSRTSGSNAITIYMDCPIYSKALVHIQCVALAGNPTDLMTKVDSIPSTEIFKPTNELNTLISRITPEKIGAASKTEFDNLEIGGRNLILNSNEEVTNSEYPIKIYTMSEIMVEGEVYTCRIWGILGTGKEAFSLYVDDGNGARELTKLQDNKDGTYSATFIGKKGLYTNKSYIYVFPLHSDVLTTSTIKKIKLEKGNKPTDWTPAPEDKVNKHYFYSAITKGGWYRIAKLNSIGVGIIQIARDYNYAPPENYTLFANCGYGTAKITQIGSTIRSQLISKVRAVLKGNEIFIEIYINENIKTENIYVNIIPLMDDTSFQTYNFDPGNVPDGYSVYEFELSSTPIVGDVKGNLTGIADIAIKDKNKNDIADTYLPTTRAMTFDNHPNYVAARFPYLELVEKAKNTYIEFWQDGGFFNFKLGNLEAQGDVKAYNFIGAVICKKNQNYNGINFKYDDDSGSVIIPANSQGYGEETIFDGLICANNVDKGGIEYIARSNGSAYHDFISINDSGSTIGQAYVLDGEITAKKYNTFGGDYAENWEYEDGNTGNEDRTGLFVTFKGNKIRISQKGDNLAKVGVVSATPSIVGNSDGKEWAHKYLKDVYGREIWQDVENEDGTVSKERVVNPEYDETLKYIKRKDRSEWDSVGTHGKLVVRDDGTCQVDGFCVPTDGGIATAAENGFYVMERLDENHIRIYMK